MERANPFEQSQEPVVLPFTRAPRKQEKHAADNRHTDAHTVNTVRNARNDATVDNVHHDNHAHTSEHVDNVRTADNASTVDNAHTGHSVNMRTRMLPYADDDVEDVPGPVSIGFMSSEGTIEDLEGLIDDEPEFGTMGDDDVVSFEDAYDDSIFDTMGTDDDAQSVDDEPSQDRHGHDGKHGSTVHTVDHADTVRNDSTDYHAHTVDNVDSAGTVGARMAAGEHGADAGGAAAHVTVPNANSDVIHAIDVLSTKAMPTVRHRNDGAAAPGDDGRVDIWKQEGFGDHADGSNPFKPVEVDTEDNRRDYELTRNSTPHGKHRRITNGPLGYRSRIKSPVNTPGSRKNLRGMHMDPLGVLALFFAFVPMLGMILGVFSFLRYRSNKYENGRMIPIIAMIINSVSIILLIITMSLGILSNTVGGFNGPGINEMQNTTMVIQQ